MATALSLTDLDCGVTDREAYQYLLSTLSLQQFPRHLPPVPPRRRGRPQRQFANGLARPSQGFLHSLLPTGWWWGWDQTDGPIFCRFYAGVTTQERYRSLVQLTLGPDEWAGLWLVSVDAKDLGLDSVWVPDAHGWIPRVQLRNGNGYPWTVEWGYDFDRERVKAVALQRGWITDADWTAMAGFRAQREAAIAEAMPAVWF